MKKRFVRFSPKKENYMEVVFKTHEMEYRGTLIDISLTSVGFIATGPHAEELLNMIGQAQIFANNTPTDLGDVIIVRSERYADNIEPAGLLIVLKSLRNHMPIENLMKFLENESGKSPYQFELAHGKFTLADFYKYEGSDDIIEKTNLFSTMHDSWVHKDVYQFERYREPSLGKRVVLDRERPSGEKDYLIFGSNDYLGLSAHPKVIQAAKDALDKYGFGSTGSPVTTGLTEEHRKLSDLVAQLFHKEEAVLFNSGYAANVGILNGICRGNDLVLYDQIAHASIQDAIQMLKGSGVECYAFRHNNMKHLEKLLINHRKNFKGCLIVTEGIFSMDGFIAQMDEIVRLAKKYNARTYLDVAHDFGVIGKEGLGAADYYGVLDEVDIIMGTFSKIGGGIGGFCVGSKALKDYIRMMSRAFMFSVSIPPSTAAAMYTALKIFKEEPQLVQKLKDNIRYFVTQLRSLGVEIDANHQSSICPVIIGNEEKLSKMAKILFDNGIYVTPILFPAVSKNKCRFRFTVTALHDKSDLDYAILVLKLALSETKNVQAMTVVDDNLSEAA